MSRVVEPVVVDDGLELFIVITAVHEGLEFTGPFLARKDAQKYADRLTSHAHVAPLTFRLWFIKGEK